MAEQFLHRPDVVTCFEQVRRKRMPQRMDGSRFGEFRCLDCALDGPLDGLRIEVMPPDDSRARVHRFVVGRKDPEPTELRVLAFQRIRKHKVRSLLAAILLEKGACHSDLIPQRLYQRQGQDRDAVLAAFAAPHQYLAALHVNILDTQLRALEQPHARSVEQARDQLIHAAHLLQDEGYLDLGQYHRALGGRFGRLMPSLQGNSMPMTYLDKNSSAHNAWL